MDSLPGGGSGNSSSGPSSGAGAGGGSVVLCRPLVDPAHITAPQVRSLACVTTAFKHAEDACLHGDRLAVAFATMDGL